MNMIDEKVIHEYTDEYRRWKSNTKNIYIPLYEIVTKSWQINRACLPPIS